jgi:thymidylate synthase (FAD)
MPVIARQIDLICRPSVDWEAINRALGGLQVSWRRADRIPDSDHLVEFAGRICYMSFGEKQSPRTNGEYIRNLIDQGHGSVLEHATWTFLLSNVSRAFTHQLVRHRVGFSYSQLSQQYVDHSDSSIAPAIDLTRFPNAEAAWNNVCEAFSSAYQSLDSALRTDIDRMNLFFPSVKEKNRFVRSFARGILPESTLTKIVVTGNARAIRHFLRIRGGTYGDPEMRDVCVKLLRTMAKESPALFEDFSVVQTDDGFESVICSSP